MTVKDCTKCGNTKRLTDFHRNHTCKGGRLHQCKTCVAARHKVYERANNDKRTAYHAKWVRNNRQVASRQSRDSRIRTTYGVSQLDYLEMLLRQNHGCAICKTKVPGGRNKSSFHIDHCHATGKVRGLLCHKCNIGLGHFNDSEELLNAAANYIRTHQ